MRKLLYVILIIATLAGCSDQNRNEELLRAESLADHDPDKALAILDSINPSQLNQHDRYMYDFLSIKASDKAYITHASDSLILSVLDRAPNYPNHSEALYYGGRVYSDLGDYPTAIKYFQSAIESLDTLHDDCDLISRIYSQTGRLLNNLRLYNEAIPYLESALSFDYKCEDTISVIYDLQLLGAINFHNGNYKVAEDIFRKSIELSKNFPEEHTAKSKMYLAGIEANLNRYDSAVSLIHDVPNQVSKITRPLALAYACEIYAHAKMYDTAYIYAKEIIDSNYKDYLNCAYNVILNTPIKNSLSPDSLSELNTAYFQAADRLFEESDNQLAITQQSHFNYKIHEHKLYEAEKKVRLYKNITVGLIIFVIILVGNIIYLLYGKEIKSFLIKITRTLISSSTKFHEKAEFSITYLHHEQEMMEEQRKSLQKELMSTINASESTTYIVPAQISCTDTYQQLLSCIENGKYIPENDELWDSLEAAVVNVFPNFINNLSTLTLTKFSKQDKIIVLLIKCGIRPSKMCAVLNKSNGAIGSRRETLCIRMFDKKLGHKTFDKVIYLI